MDCVSQDPQILSPRKRSRATAFSDENLDLLAHLLDDWFPIPGTSIRFGLDGIVGFVPVVGDVLGGIASCIIIMAAWLRGVSYVTLARMLANWGIEVLLGSVPFLGNVFDIAWKANRRNYRLLTRSLSDPYGVARRSWLFFGIICLVFFTLLALPMIFLAWLSTHLLHVASGVHW